MNAFFATGCVTWVGKLQTMPNGGSVLEMGFAVDKYPKDAPPIFTTLKLYKKYADAMATSLAKGQRFAVAGELRLSQWEKDGVKHEKAFFVVSEMKTLAKFSGEAASAATPDAATPAVMVDDDEPMPF